MTALSILQNLTEPGRTLVFCDDTNVFNPPKDAAVLDLRILCAVAMPSEAYATAQSAMAQRLQALSPTLTEFHAAEIVNPKSSSAWKQVPMAERIGAFAFMAEMLSSSAAKLYRANVSKAQFEQLKSQAMLIGPVSAGHHAGLKRVFLRCLLERLESRNAKTVLILDQNKPLAAPIIENWPEGKFLIGGGPIAADSSSVAGLQIADMAVFSIGRYWQKRQALYDGKGNPFDVIALDVVAALAERCEFLLTPATAETTSTASATQ